MSVGEIQSEENGVEGELSGNCRNRVKRKVLVKIIQRTSQVFSNRGSGKQTEKLEHRSLPGVQWRVRAFKRCSAGVGEVKEKCLRVLKPGQLNLDDAASP